MDIPNMEDDNIIDMSKITPEESAAIEKRFMEKTYFCPKCKATHSRGGDNLEGTICFPNPGKYHCDGVLRKLTPKDREDRVKK